MRAASFVEPNAPLRLVDLPAPVPGPGQVAIRMRASGVCGTDIHVWNGHFPVPTPLVLGHEPVGVVEALGAGVVHLKLGDRVGVSWFQKGCGRCSPCRRRKVQYCDTATSWINHGGGHCEVLLADADGCTLLPDGLDFAVAAPLFCAGYTVMSGYRNGRPQPGDRVAVIGIGGLGHLAVQVAKALGHEVVAVTGTESKRAEAKSFGADEVLVVKEHAGLELAAMGGADLVLSTSNSMQHNSQVVHGLRPEGRLVTMAVGGEPLAVDPMYLLMKQASVVGSMQDDRADLEEVLQLAAAGKVVPKLELYTLDEINRLMERQRDGKVRYRGVVAL